MAIDRKARKPTLNGLEVRFVRFSGRALTQGVVNARIDGVPVRIYSTAKTIADCFKYRHKNRIETALHALRAGIQLNKCSRERLLHFVDICRIGKLLRAVDGDGTRAGQVNRPPWKTIWWSGVTDKKRRKRRL